MGEPHLTLRLQQTVVGLRCGEELDFPEYALASEASMVTARST